MVVANRWLALRLEFVGACVILAAAFFAVLARAYIDPGLVVRFTLFVFRVRGWDRAR